MELKHRGTLGTVKVDTEVNGELSLTEPYSTIFPCACTVTLHSLLAFVWVYCRELFRYNNISHILT